MDEILNKYLEKNKIEYIVHRHDAVFKVSESNLNKEIALIPGLRCKTLFLKDDKERFYLVGMPAEKRLDFKKLEKNAQVKKLRFGSEGDLWKHARLKAGSVSIFGAIHSIDIILILDKEVWNAGIVQFHPNINTETLEIVHPALERYFESLPNTKHIFEL